MHAHAVRVVVSSALTICFGFAGFASRDCNFDGGDLYVLFKTFWV